MKIRCLIVKNLSGEPYLYASADEAYDKRNPHYLSSQLAEVVSGLADGIVQDYALLDVDLPDESLVFAWKRRGKG